MGPLRFRRHRPFDRGSYDATSSPEPATDLADEAEAFLAGDLAELHARRGGRIPIWAVLNRLAHGSFEQLTVLAEQGGPGWRAYPLLSAWFTAERSLAQRLLADSGGPEGLRQVQTVILVPLELSLIEQSKHTTFPPSAVLRAVTSALDAHHLGL